MWGVGLASEGKMRKEASELIGDDLEAELVLQIQGWGPNARVLPTATFHVCGTRFVTS